MAISAEDLERVLRKSELPRGQVTLLKALYDPKGESVPLSRIFQRVDWSKVGGFNQVLQEFAKRVDETPGFAESTPGYEAFFERETVDGEGRLGLRPEAMEAIERIPELADALEQPVSELLDEGVTIAAGGDSDANEPGAGEPSDSSSAAKEVSTFDGDWRPDSPEDQLLESYVQHRGGTVVTDVPVGRQGPGVWPEDASTWTVDAVRIPDDEAHAIHPAETFAQEQLREVVANRHVEVLTAGTRLNRGLVGRAVTARDLFERDYHPGTLESVVLSSSVDEALAWVCRRRRVRVERPSSETRTSDP